MISGYVKVNMQRDVMKHKTRIIIKTNKEEKNGKLYNPNELRKDSMRTIQF